ncbi:glutamyl-tRNA reductase [Lentilactobacillus raoultii]|uniref:Glutamyl-tRNA reductase n=1 Tax=Lentilactobacillus raoultii TaxID=1987503 RepID=A0ABW3PE78_9LACO|nr:glutamyl-tRNA reductase [Lentilactobacillus raoultii]
MYIIYVSLNYRQVPIAIREKFVVSKEQLSRVNQLLNSEKSILENVILSTCNRTEIYAVVDQIHTGRYYIKRFLANWFHVTLNELNKWVVVGTKELAVGHLMKVATGLDSLLVGEPQILGQVKDAFFNARLCGSTGIILNHLFKEAITFSKKMHTNYRMSELSQTSGQAGLHQIKLTLKDVRGTDLVIVGIGEVGTHVLKNAVDMGFGTIHLFNHHSDQAKLVAESYPAWVKAEKWQDLLPTVLNADAVVMAASVKRPLLSGQSFQISRVKTRIIVDLGVPKNLDERYLPEQIIYHDIDHITEILTQNQLLKKKMVAEITKVIPDAVHDFYVWQKQLHVVPIIKKLRESSLDVEKTVYDSLLRKLPELNAHERKVISKHMKSIINQMIKGPIKEVKELSIEDNANVDLAFFCQIFGLPVDDEIQSIQRGGLKQTSGMVDFKQEKLYEK